MSLDILTSHMFAQTLESLPLNWCEYHILNYNDTILNKVSVSLQLWLPSICGQLISLSASLHPLLVFALTSQSWSWMQWRWRRPCSGPTLGFSCSPVTLIASVITLTSLQTHTKPNPQEMYQMSHSYNKYYSYYNTRHPATNEQRAKLIYVLLEPFASNICNKTFVPCRMLAGHMSILVTTTNTGTLRASARPRCSLVMPTMPALLPTWDESEGRTRETGEGIRS